MAGQAAKKQAKTAESKTRIYFGIALSCAFIHIIARCFLGRTATLKWTWFSALLTTVVTYVTYSGIASSLSLGVAYSVYQDIFIINALVQLITVYSKYGWLLYLLIPGYALAKCGRFIFDFMTAPSLDTDSDPRSAKKKEKLERKIRQGRVKLMH